MINSEKGKLDVFIGGLRPNITKDMMIEDNPPETFSKAFGQALRSKAMRQNMIRDKGLIKELVSLALVQKQS